jgi:hypothetical protein
MDAQTGRARLLHVLQLSEQPRQKDNGAEHENKVHQNLNKPGAGTDIKYRCRIRRVGARTRHPCQCDEPRCILQPVAVDPSTHLP